MRGTVQNSFEWYKFYIGVDWTKFRMVSQAFFLSQLSLVDPGNHIQLCF